MNPEEISGDNRHKRRLAAIVFTDGVNFSARMSSDEEHTLDLINRDLNLMRQHCQDAGGEVLKSTGDGLLMCFSSAVQAVDCALKIQQSLAEVAEKLSAHDVLAHRIGIHLGDIFIRDGDVMGNGVNIAARLESKSAPGGICISQTVYDVVKGQLIFNAEFLGELLLKNIQEPVLAYHVNPKTVNTSTSENHDQLQVNDLVVNRYRIQGSLGQGGFGRTYLVVDTQRFDEPCVLKEFMPHWTAGYTAQNARELFQKEAGILYQIHHPQIPKFLAWFEENGRLFLVQEYVKGKTYSEILKERHKKQQTFTEAEILRWLKELLPVLTYIHDQGLIHRDISPDNIMFSEACNKPILIDFGLVKQTLTKLQAISSGRHSDESQGSFAGKTGYAPREQISMGYCFPCSDVYALSITAIVLLTGMEPTYLVDPQTFEWQWRQYTQVSDAFANVLTRMLADRPADRYQTANEVLEVLNQLQSTSTSTTVVSPTPPAPQDRQPSAEDSSNSVTPLVSNSASNPPSPSNAPPIVPSISPEFRTQCEQALAQAVGPMAKLLIKQILTQSPEISRLDLVNQLALKIPNPQAAEAFRQKMRTVE